MIVVVEFVSAKYGRGAALAVDQDAVEEFVAVLPTKRSAMAWATMRLGPLRWLRAGVIVILGTPSPGFAGWLALVSGLNPLAEPSHVPCWVGWRQLAIAVNSSYRDAAGDWADSELPRVVHDEQSGAGDQRQLQRVLRGEPANASVVLADEVVLVAAVGVRGRPAPTCVVPLQY
ncbi:MAG TPA: hypothetical protein VNT27_13510 [Propionibacteriaceae bacterium]|nr:hypothetical protein [Propionibacteriaceae bacterium]